MGREVVSTNMASTPFGSRRQQRIGELTDVTDDIRNSFYEYVIAELDGAAEFLDLHEAVAASGEQYLRSITEYHAVERLALADRSVEGMDERFSERASTLNEWGIQQTDAALDSIAEFGEVAGASERLTEAEALDLSRYESDLRWNIAELGLPPDDTGDVADAAVEAVQVTNDGGIDGATDYLGSQLEELRSLREVADETGDYGLQENVDPVTLIVVGYVGVVLGVGLYYCAYKNDKERCEGVGKAAGHAAKFGKVYSAFQLA